MTMNASPKWLFSKRFLPMAGLAAILLIGTSIPVMAQNPAEPPPLPSSEKGDAPAAPTAKAPTVSEDQIKQALQGMGTPADAVPLSLNSIVLFALSDNPDVKMALAREEQAQANVGKARAKFFPLIDLVAEGGQEFNDPAGGVVSGGHSNLSRRYTFTARQMVYDWNQTESALRQQKQLEKSSALDTQVNIENTLTDTIQYYLQMLEYQRTMKDTTAFLLRMRGLVKTVSDTYEAGAASKATLDYAKSRLASAENDLNSARSSYNDAVSNLEYLTGKLPAFVAENPDDLDPTRLDLNGYIKMAEAQNTGVELGASDLQALAYKLKAAKRASYPTVNFLVTGEQTFNDSGETEMKDNVEGMLQVNYRLFDGHERKEQVNLVRAQIKELEVNQEKILKDLRREIKLAYNQITATQESIKQAQKEIAASEALQNLNRENFDQGSISIIELIEGEERLNFARNKLHTLSSSLYLDTYRLLITAGILEKGFFCDTCGMDPERQPAS